MISPELPVISLDEQIVPPSNLSSSVSLDLMLTDISMPTPENNHNNSAIQCLVMDNTRVNVIQAKLTYQRPVNMTDFNASQTDINIRDIINSDYVISRGEYLQTFLEYDHTDATIEHINQVTGGNTVWVS